HPNHITHPGHFHTGPAVLSLDAPPPDRPAEVCRTAERAHVNSLAACWINTVESSGPSAIARRRSNARVTLARCSSLSGYKSPAMVSRYTTGGSVGPAKRSTVNDPGVPG